MANTDNKQTPRKKRLIILLVVPALIVLGGGYFYLTGSRYVSTDNAYLKADKTPIAAEISGKTITVQVKDNQHVNKGDVLFEIEPEQYRIAVAQDEAKLANVKSDIETMRADYAQKAAALAKTEDSLAYWVRENNRYQTLAKTQSVSKAKADDVQHQWQGAQKDRDVAEQELTAARARLNDQPDTAVEDHPAYHEALADLDKAKLDLEHTRVVAPVSGTVSNVTLQTGEYVAEGLPLFSIVADQHTWIEANFKETDLTYVRPGQSATIQVDTYPGKTWTAKVASITPATGSEFSILPAQNASGNWVKVVQRIMVRLEFNDAEHMPPLSAGMSTYTTIDTGATRLQRLFGSK